MSAFVPARTGLSGSEEDRSGQSRGGEVDSDPSRAIRARGFEHRAWGRPEWDAARRRVPRVMEGTLSAVRTTREVAVARQPGGES